MSAANLIAETILEGFDKHYALFREVSAQAQQRFERADWVAVAQANRTRIELYDETVVQTVGRVRDRVPDANREALWPEVKRAFITLLYDHLRPECAETFYNSVACRVLHRTYYRNEYIFWRPAVSTEFVEGEQPTYRCFYPTVMGLRRTLLQVLGSFGLHLPFEDLRRDIRALVRALRETLLAPRERFPNFQVQVLSSLFFRNKAAYIVGRVINGNLEQPFAIPLRHSADGKALCLDALLARPEHIAALFSLARSYFMVDMDVPSAVVAFLKELVPSKSTAELYAAVGLQKPSKTLFYRELFWHLKHSQDQFEVAPGIRGMVMSVFTLPSFPFVFKVIKDYFPPPKVRTREEIRSKYLLVKYHDRVGRMADALEYSDVALPLARISPALLAELRQSCASSLEPDGERLVIKHLYVERRMVPLDIWLLTGDPVVRRRTLDELGWAIKDLVNANIFPGDLLLKNFGVTRWGRVLFYDYDDLALMRGLVFRRLPQPRSDEEEMASEPWFAVGPTDVFPEELISFLVPAGPMRDEFLEMHPELVDPDWWSSRQAEVAAGIPPDAVPYPESLRFSHRPDTASLGRAAPPPQELQ